MESKHQTLQGLAFPLQPEAQRALQQLRQKAINYIQLVGAAPRPAPARTPPPSTHAQTRTRVPPPCALWSPCTGGGTLSTRPAPALPAPI